ncbi:trimeric intracellular cation channel family protein [Emticicia sp. 21SJ11W-3]|uniref:trimeric intracellular cation channel family protein n=1 Tax=Emticicia sp. 21SJ11W-3 TaxID=2916755 RepID=UPI00209F6EC9|nr:trimeric intracellular cation channel family protein [Emticicia sp. 21SJ11W-3]UTA69290.1 trimeric intracellular cation channel family protein [Emticicia sp. 21SJ11W-3]
MEFFTFINIGGTIAFAASGTMAAMRKDLDIFGLVVIAFVTSVGGGTIRDMLIGHLPVRWILDSTIIILIVMVAMVTVIFRHRIVHLDKTLTLFDSLGLGFFALRGIQEGISAGLNVPSCIILGTITACFGGVIRDIFLNEIPALFRTGQLYATVCIIGGSFYFALRKLNLSVEVIDIITVLCIFGIRTLAISKNISLPKINKM